MAELRVILTTVFGLLDAPAKIKEYVIEPLKLQFSYLCRSDSIIESLKAKVQMLDDNTSNLQQRVDAADHNLEIVEPHVKHWFERGDKIKNEADRILRSIPEVQQGCINGSCTNLRLRYSATRDARKIAKAIDEVLDAGKFEIVAHPVPPPGREAIPVVSGTDFKSRKNIEEEIMAALKDDKVYLIGICGMGGVGKTTMVKKIEKRAREENLFRVAMAVVSQQPDLKTMQKQIAEDLDLKLKEDETVYIRARQIYIGLMKETRILIIIDDIWERMNLEELGIPSQSDHKGCKIILTSRDRSVCKGIEAMLRPVATEIQATETENTKIFPLECLDEEEAWVLFRAKAGSCVADRDLHQIAKDVAKECKGLPLALVTVGCSMADEKAKHVWEDALVQLQRSAQSNISRVPEDVYRPLELSYNHLESHEARYLFLLCCLFPEDSQISLMDLLYYGVGLSIFSSVETMREARNRVYKLVEMLESRYMLMDGGTKEGIKCVKMHDVIRDMAISIASTGKHVFMISHHTGLNDWPRKDSYENYTHISLSRKGRITERKDSYENCPKLKMLRMVFDWSKAGHNVADTFFYRMRELNVLDIGSIASLPCKKAILEDGEGHSNWDVFTQTKGRIENGDTGDLADDHYHHCLEDIVIIRSLGVHAYWLSLSWAKILPTGKFDDVNVAGIWFYNGIIDNHLFKGIQPILTIQHDDISQGLLDCIHSRYACSGPFCDQGIGRANRGFLSISTTIERDGVGYQASKIKFPTLKKIYSSIVMSRVVSTRTGRFIYFKSQ